MGCPTWTILIWVPNWGLDMNTPFKVLASYNILQYMCAFIHVLISITVSKMPKKSQINEYSDFMFLMDEIVKPPCPPKHTNHVNWMKPSRVQGMCMILSCYYFIRGFIFAIKFSYPSRRLMYWTWSPRGMHSIVKLNTMCEQNKSTFYKLHHQNGSKFYQIFPYVDIHVIYYMVENGNQIWWFVFFNNHTVFN